MDKNLTVSARALLTSGLVVVALVAAYLIGAERGDAADAPAEDPAPVAGAATDPPSGTLTMIGIGTATAVPDQVAFDLSVGLTRDELDVALADTSGLLKDVISTLTEKGVAEKDIRTTGLSMNAQYDYPREGGRVFRGYRVNQQVVVTAPLEKGGRLVSAVVAAGGGSVRVGDLRLQISDPEAAMGNARDAAVDQARAKAEEYAAASGQTLGDVVTLSEVAADEGRNGLVEQAYADAASTASAVPIQAGESDLTARVQVVWELR